MKVKEIFPQNIYGDCFLNLEDNYINKLVASIELLRRGDIEGETFSNNSFGWHSSNIPQGGVFQNLTEAITKKSYEFCKNMSNFNFNKIEMIGLWANINYKNDINWAHKHAGDLSGVYYLKAKENCGDLVLDNFNYSENCKINAYLTNKYKTSITAKKDKLILFDSECVHAVLKNFSEGPRISMSFNLKIL
tara:strand:+ start:225 stop:797 length:573 start_codon:yes stop_codon:yes gene_type:complete